MVLLRAICRLQIVVIAFILIACDGMKLEVDLKVPPIATKSTDGRQVKLTNEGIEVIEFWQNGCAGCVKIMPTLDTYALENNIKVYAINSINEEKDIKKFQRDKNFKQINLLKDDLKITWGRYKVIYVPSIFIIKDGVLKEKILGDRTFEFVKEKLEKLI